MGRFRFHIGTLLILALILGVGFAALCGDCSTVTGADLSLARQESGKSTWEPVNDSEWATNSANGSISSLIVWTDLQPPGNIATVSLCESDETWDSSIFSLTLGMLSVSILLAIHRTEKRRAFWLGFALFGWTYLGLSLVPSIESRLLTTKVLGFFDSKVPRSIPAGLA